MPVLDQRRECNARYVHYINDYFKHTSILPSESTTIQYCDELTKSRRPRATSEGGNHVTAALSLARLIDFYRSLPYARSYRPNNPNNPVTSYGVLQIDDEQEVPLYIEADIRREHLQRYRDRPNFGDDVKKQMRLMGKLATDDHGHLLAHSLGGSSTALNIVPMARNVNRHLQYSDGAQEMGIPRSFWRSNEDWIGRFLKNRDYSNGRVTWRLALQYAGDTVINPGGSGSFRPIRFTVQFTAYTDKSDPDSEYYRTHEISFFNDNDDGCLFEEQRRNIEYIKDLLPQCYHISLPDGPEGNTL